MTKQAIMQLFESLAMKEPMKIITFGADMKWVFYRPMLEEIAAKIEADTAIERWSHAALTRTLLRTERRYVSQQERATAMLDLLKE